MVLHTQFEVIISDFVVPFPASMVLPVAPVANGKVADANCQVAAGMQCSSFQAVL